MVTKILLVIHVDSYFRNLIEVARALAQEEVGLPTFYFPRLYPSVEKDIEVCRSEGFEFIRGFSGVWVDNFSGATESARPSFFARMRRYARENFFMDLLRELKSKSFDKKRIRELLLQHKVSLLILAGDNVGYDTGLFIKECRINKIPSIIIPAWMAGPLEAFNAYRFSPRHNAKNLFNKVASWIWPQLLFKHGNCALVRWPASETLAMKVFGVFPPKPWALNSGFADKIFSESEAMRRYMSKEGIRPEQIENTGSIAGDRLYIALRLQKQKRDSLYEKLGFVDGKPMLLCAIPPNQLGGYGRPDCEFKSYDDLLRAWIGELSACDTHNIVLSLHPSQSIEYMKDFELENVKICDDKIFNLIPLCDIFVASISATIQWAIACGKPVLNYDVYLYRYTDYLDAKGVLCVESFSEFSKLLKKLTRDLEFFESIRIQQSKDSSYWGMLDGRSGARIAAAIKDLL